MFCAFGLLVRNRIKFPTHVEWCSSVLIDAPETTGNRNEQACIDRNE